MPNSPAFQFYPKDFLGDANTLVMSAEEIGVYLLLLCSCWTQDGLPQEFKKLARLARVGEKKFKTLWVNSISVCFIFDEATKKYRHPRLDRERDKQRAKSQKAIDAANARWHADASPEQCTDDAQDVQAECSSFFNLHSSSTGLKEKSIVTPSLVDAEAASTAHGGNGFSPESEAAVAAAPGKRSPVEEVFEAWRSELSTPQAVLDDKRRRILKSALKQFSVEDLCRVPLGVKQSPWHMGVDGGKRYTRIETVYANADRIEEFLALTGNGSAYMPKSTPHPIDLCDRCDEDGFVPLEENGKIRMLRCSHIPIAVIPEPNGNGQS